MIDSINGVVELKQWWQMRRPHFIAVAGKITVLEANKVLGFDVNEKTDSNYALKVEGPTESVIILGCQYRGVAKTDFSDLPEGTWVLE